jgi:anti-sigma B factor antagonist
MEIQIQTHPNGPIAVAALNGRIDAANSRQIRRQFDRCLEMTSRFVFDCHAVDFIDSSGLGAVVACLRKAMEKDGDIRLAHVSPRVKLVFELTQAEKLFAFFRDADQALASYADRQPRNRETLS